MSNGILRMSQRGRKRGERELVVARRLSNSYLVGAVQFGDVELWCHYLDNQVTPSWISGIYAIVCTANGRFYIGSSNSIGKRNIVHKWNLRHNRHTNGRLQNSWNKYGESAFSFLVIEKCPPDQLLEREAHFIAITKSIDPLIGFNLDEVTAGGIRRVSEETKNKMRLAAKGRTYPPEFGRKISATKKGKPGPIWTDERRERLSRSMIGHFVSDETKRKIGAIHRGKIISEAHKELIRVAARAKRAAKAQASAERQPELF